MKLLIDENHLPLPMVNPKRCLNGLVIDTRLFAAAGMLAALFLGGCSEREPAAQKPQERPLAGAKLRLLVVGDPALAEAVERQRGEWTSQSGAEFEVERASQSDLENKDFVLTQDAILCRSRDLGPLAERKQIAPLPNQKQLQRGTEGQWSETFDLLRLRECVWGDSVMALPFGSPVFVCYCRTDLLKRLDRKPPRTWSEYQALAELLGDRSKLGAAAPAADRSWVGSLEPLAPGWAGLTLLARAVPYAKSRSNYSTLLGINSMDPLVAGPPFVRALEELAAAAKPRTEAQLQYDPEGVRAAFWRGECGMAITWPNAAKADGSTKSPAAGSTDPPAPASSPPPLEATIVELPGSPEVYNVSQLSWNKRSEDEDSQVPLLGIAGRVGAVSAKCSQPTAAMQLLAWLSSDALASQVSATSSATTLFRRSQRGNVRAWVEPEMPSAAAADYARVLTATFQRHEAVLAMRIPGGDEYLAALDEAVKQTTSGKLSALSALAEAVKKWDEITERRGLEPQKAAYRRCLGLD